MTWVTSNVLAICVNVLSCVSFLSMCQCLQYVLLCQDVLMCLAVLVCQVASLCQTGQCVSLVSELACVFFGYKEQKWQILGVRMHKFSIYWIVMACFSRFRSLLRCSAISVGDLIPPVHSTDSCRIRRTTQCTSEPKQYTFQNISSNSMEYQILEIIHWHTEPR